ncbi:MAG: D-alanine--D-alanine ligase [Phycisphaerales bacterium]|nr:D-alanine--D-alanine ligase [Phycisphaerales bacterium]
MRRVLVLMGGPDAERAVSLESGAAVAAALDATHRVTGTTIDRPDAAEMRELVRSHAPDVVFPVLHGPYGEGGPLQETLETCGVPYVGSNPQASARAMDKMVAKRIAAEVGVPTPAAQVIAPADRCDLEPPLVLKPVDDGSSVDLRIATTDAAVASARAELAPRRRRLLAERYVSGRELTVGIVADRALPIVEIVPAVAFYDYAAKYERTDTQLRVHPSLPTGVSAALADMAERVCRAIGCRDLARVDFMLDAAGPWFLEVNTMPGFTSHSLLPLAARAAGEDMPALCARVVDLAARRATRPSPT